MSHGEFEKQVRDKMNEIHLQPSESVWSRVEHGLDAGKKRRRIIIWVPVMIILGIGLFLLSTPYRQNNLIVENQRTLNYPDPATQQENSAVDPATQKETPAADPAAQKEASAVSPPSANVSPANPPVQVLPVIPLNEPGGKTKEQNIKEIDPEVPSNIPESSPSPAQSERRRETHYPDAVENEKINASNNNIMGISPLNQLIGIRSPEAAWKQVQLPEIISISEKKVTTGQKKNDSRYSFNINIAGGISHEKEGRLLGVFQSGTADFPTPLYGSPNTMYKAAPIDPGIFLSAGMGVERKLATRWALKTGLQYSRFSNSIMVGNRMQQERQVFTGNSTSTTISTYYTPAPIKRYTMHYDFVELPLSILYLPGNGKMKLHAGTAASALISSNALHFDAANGVYYENNDLLNKMQLSLSAGIKFRIPVKNSNRLYVGPDFRYQVSGLLKDNSNEKHLWSGAIEASWQLNK